MDRDLDTKTSAKLTRSEKLFIAAAVGAVLVVVSLFGFVFWSLVAMSVGLGP